MQEPLSAVGQAYRDFLITKYLPLDELQSTLTELVHIPTSARILHIANDDPENLFCLAFQTLPSSSNGVAHILEHTVLCGSKKFPIKDPFFSMIRRSLNTYMNALTGQDFTCYPAATQVEKDFYNLLEVYLDAVFHPELKKLSFMQEGHRFEFEKPDDPSTRLLYQGVVYNEMKGAMSSSESRLWEALAKHLTPDLPYAHNSGGNPKEIPNLTHSELIEFHQNFYHPSRCLFYFYGNLPLKKHLDFLSEKGLEGVEKIPLLPPLPLQKRFLEPLEKEARYPSAPSEGATDMIALSWLTAPIGMQEEILALTLLDVLLMDTDASPLKKALLKSKLCKEADSSIDTEMSEAPWTIVCKGAEAKNGKKIKDLIFKTLKKAASSSFLEEDVEAALHQLEFERKEIGGEGMPFGLSLFFRSGLIKQHGGDPENGLLVHQLFTDLRNKLKNKDYLPHLLEKYILKNPHFVLLTLKADPNLSKEEEEEEKKRLLKIESSLQEAEKKRIVEESLELKKYQEAQLNQSLDCLPKISIKDVPIHAKDYPLYEFSTKRLNVFSHASFTNQILYADLSFSLPDLPLEDLPILSLFTRFLTEVGAGGRDYEENLLYEQAHVGELSASLSFYPFEDNPNIFVPRFSLRGKALFQKADKLFSLFSDFAKSPDFSDLKRIQELLAQHTSSLQSRLVKNSMGFASMEAVSGNSELAFMINQLYGLPYYQKVQSWAKKFPKKLLSEFERLSRLILGGQKADLVLTCSEKELRELEKKEFFGLDFPLLTPSPWKGGYRIEKPPAQARFTPAPIAFTALGMKAPTYKDTHSPFLMIASELFDNCYLHQEIREKGGAYGSGANYAPASGNFYFYSFRDPNLASTLNAFEKALEKIAAGDFTQEELEEGKLSVLQTLDAPLPPGARGAAAYAWKQSGRTFAKRDLYRKKILEATKEEIELAVQTALLAKEKTPVSMLGKELYEKEKEKLPFPLSILPIEK